MVEISKSGSGEGLGGVIPRGYSKIGADWQRSHPDALQRPTLYDSCRPRAVIRLRTLHARRTSTACPPGLRARRPAPMIDLYLEEIPTDADRLTTFGTFALIEEAVQGTAKSRGHG